MMRFDDHNYEDENRCACTWCVGGGKMRYGLNIPECGERNAWWVIKYAHQKYIRWTGTWVWLRKLTH